MDQVKILDLSIRQYEFIEKVPKAVLGVCYLVNEIESWQYLLTDNKIQFAFLMTIGFLLINSSEKLFKKIKESL